MIKHSEKTLTFEVDLLKDNIADLLKQVEEYKFSPIEIIDLINVSSIDSAGVVFLDEIYTNFNEPEFINSSAKITSAITKFSSLNLAAPEEKIQLNLFERIGSFFYEWKESFMRIEEGAIFK